LSAGEGLLHSVRDHFNISHSHVLTRLKYNWTFSDPVTTNLLMNLPAKEF